MLRHKKHFVTLVCLVVGMLVLTTAVYANYDDAKGYTNYKDSLKHLLFEADNYTLNYQAKIKMDDEMIQTLIGNEKLAGKNRSHYEKSGDSSDEKSRVYDYYTFTEGNKYYSYYPETNTYYEGKISSDRSGSLMGSDDATVKKAVRFTELLADTLIGDLKNNVILESSKDGVKEYSIHVSGNQIPEIVNAGLSLAFTASNSEDYENDVTSKFGNEPYIDNVNMRVTLDEKGRLINNELEASLVGIDQNGKKHKGTMEVTVDITDYESTKADVFDPEGKVKEN
ncbi:hypothetical protein [Sinanaerobacter sp. ZZT-01]|uniref:hypothetical protein n=1 Tax=Sinanaerobacter sp. ZZT-01 TaxID=3111540 RepID=UPI002D76D312|nr:hypothetical protein [Sinanaerobacter sp. ZZT-01]WRR92565.1 hypothetical protein U5921_10965 [Sinanaerobacter sp. ZZT-01]